jgi:hypothetical protein
MRDSRKSVSCAVRLAEEEMREGVDPRHKQKSAEATDSKRVVKCPWRKRVRRRLKEKKLDVKRWN